MRYHITVKQLKGWIFEWKGITEFKGYCSALPEVGTYFFAMPYEITNDVSYLRTSEVVSVGYINEDNAVVGVIFDTRNSRYQIDISHVEEVH